MELCPLFHQVTTTRLSLSQHKRQQNFGTVFSKEAVTVSRMPLRRIDSDDIKLLLLETHFAGWQIQMQLHWVLLCSSLCRFDRLSRHESDSCACTDSPRESLFPTVTGVKTYRTFQYDEASRSAYTWTVSMSLCFDGANSGNWLSIIVHVQLGAPTSYINSYIHIQSDPPYRRAVITLRSSNVDSQ